MSTKAQPIVIVGGGGHAKVLINVLMRLRKFKILGYVDPRDNGLILGFPRLGGDEVLAELSKKKKIAAAIGVGKVKAGRSRMKLFSQLQELGFELPVIVAPTAMVGKGVVIGDGTVVMDAATIQPGCVLGRICIVNTGACLDHDCFLGDDVHVGPRAALSGNVTVGDATMFGIGACAVQGKRIGTDCTIGAGAAVAADCIDSGIYVGVPAKKVRA